MAIDAPPPLEAPPIERTDSLPPLEAVDGSALATNDNAQSTLIEAHVTSNAVTSAANTTTIHDTATANSTATATANSTATATPSPAPAVDLRALINKLAPIPIHNFTSAGSASSTPTTAQLPTSSPFMTLDDWRKLSLSRPELSMKLLGEPAEKKKKERGLTGMGGGWKATDGWKCESLNCIQFENRKYDTVCARCGAVRRFQRA